MHSAATTRTTSSSFISRIEEDTTRNGVVEFIESQLLLIATELN